MKRMLLLFCGQRNHIARRLMISIIAFSSLITFLISGAQLALEYRELRSGIDRQFEEIKIYLPNVAASVWDFDEKQIRLSLNALVRLPNIERVAVTTTDEAKQWSATSGSSPSTATQTYPLAHEFRGRHLPVGRMEVTASLSSVYHQLVQRAVSIVLSNGLKTFLVALFMAVLFGRLVTRRLEALALKARKLAPSALPAAASTPPPAEEAPARYDELQAVEWALDQREHRLELAAQTLKTLNLELAKRVAEQDALLQNAVVGIAMLRQSTVLSCNRRFEELFGYGPGALTGQSTRALYLSDEDFTDVGQAADRTLQHEASFSTATLMQKRDGSTFWAEMSGRAINSVDAAGDSIWIVSDITERKRAQQRLEFMAYHDALTGLPNRALARDRFQQATAGTGKVAVLCLDLDNFKTINDSLGHAIGDALIQQVAQRISQCVGSGDTVCRLGGDEFVILLQGLTGTDAAAPMILRLMEQMKLPFDLSGHELSTSFSVGVAVYPDDDPDFDALMKKGEIAMYRAKEAGRNTYRFFDEQMNVDAVEQLRVRSGLRKALEQREFVLHYQPQVDLASGALVGVEALIRWNHPELGMVPPGRFIPIAEDSGLIVPIGEWVLREACRQAAAWRRAGMGSIGVAVNLSALQFKRGNIEQSVISALEESGIDPTLLELELTESILIHDAENTLASIKSLKRMGLRLSIDDFGTGYSSLSYLKRFEVDKLKIDQSFVRDLASDPEDAAIVRAIVQMAHGLGLTTIAEGVETEPMLAHLRSFGCDQAQGYLFARPLPPEELEHWVRARKTS